MQPLIQFCQRCQKSHPPCAHSARAPKPENVLNTVVNKIPRVLLGAASAANPDGVALFSTAHPGLNGDMTGPAGTPMEHERKRAKKEKAVKKKATKKPKSGSRVSTTRVQTRAAKRPPARPGKAPSPSELKPKDMTLAQLQAYVAADLERKAAARAAKAKAQAKWRKGLK